MSELFAISGTRSFTLEEAEQLLPIICKITRQYSETVKGLIDKVDVQQRTVAQKDWKVEEEINQHIENWKSKMQKLGITPRGLWICDFPNENGYYCWKFPETTINYWHSKSDGYSKRVAIDRTQKPATENTL